MKIKIISLKGMKSENFNKLNELLRFYDGFDKLVEYLYDSVQERLGNTLENFNKITKKPQYITVVS